MLFAPLVAMWRSMGQSGKDEDSAMRKAVAGLILLSCRFPAASIDCIPARNDGDILAGDGGVRLVDAFL